jgi:hypothetical protein
MIMTDRQWLRHTLQMLQEELDNTEKMQLASNAAYDMKKACIKAEIKRTEEQLTTKK